MDYKLILSKLGTVMSFTLFELNQTPVSLSSVIMFITIMFVFVLMSKILNKLVLTRVLARFQVEESKVYTMLRLTHYLILIVGAVISFQFIGIDLSGLAVIFGLLSVGIGFGLQNVTSNFIAGIILLFERPIKIGDRVLVGETEGDVLDINIRSTTIRSLNNVTIIVPNSEFVSSSVVNWSHSDPKIRLNVAVGVSYQSDLDTVLRVLKEVAQEHPEVLENPGADVIFDSFGDSAWNMILRVWINDPKKHHIIRSELNCAIVRKFARNKVEIPFPQRDIHLRSAETIKIVRENT